MSAGMSTAPAGRALAKVGGRYIGYSTQQFGCMRWALRGDFIHGLIKPRLSVCGWITGKPEVIPGMTSACRKSPASLQQFGFATRMM